MFTREDSRPASSSTKIIDVPRSWKTGGHAYIYPNLLQTVGDICANIATKFISSKRSITLPLFLKMIQNLLREDIKIFSIFLDIGLYALYHHVPRFCFVRHDVLYAQCRHRLDAGKDGLWHRSDWDHASDRGLAQ